MADKIVISDVSTNAGINNALQDIATELNEKVLYRDNPVGTDNVMENGLDMNSFPIYNLPKATGNGQPVRFDDIGTYADEAIASAASALASKNASALSEENAATSESNAANSASNASVSAGQASTVLAASLKIANNLSDVNNVATARGNLVAAKSGANSDITSITGLTTALGVSQGGTGSTSLLSNALVVGHGTNSVTSVAVGTSGQVLVSQGASAPPVFAASPNGFALNTQVFTATGTLVVPTGVTQMLIDAVASGGGGGGGGSGSSATGSGGGGGGAGQSTQRQTVAVTGGETLTVTIGNAGSSAAAATNGGNGGSLTIVGSVSGSLVNLSGGNGGVAGINLAGGSGGGAGGVGFPNGSYGNDTSSGASGSPGGNGGPGASSPFGGGGGSGRGASANGIAGMAAGGYGGGGGGGGGYYVSGVGTGGAGGAGTKGFAAIRW